MYVCLHYMHIVLYICINSKNYKGAKTRIIYLSETH